MKNPSLPATFSGKIDQRYTYKDANRAGPGNERQGHENAEWNQDPAEKISQNLQQNAYPRVPMADRLLQLKMILR